MESVWKPHATVAAIVEDNGRFLMVEELKDGKKVLNQPAGHLESDESLIEAVIRETREETAGEFKPAFLTGIYRWPQIEKNRSFLRFTFFGHCSHFNPEQALDDDIIRTLWLTRDELAAEANRLRSPMVLNCIDDYLNGKQYPLDILIDVNE